VILSQEILEVLNRVIKSEDVDAAIVEHFKGIFYDNFMIIYMLRSDEIE